MYAKNKKIYPAYVSKHSSKREKEIILFVIPNGKAWNYIAAKKLPTLLRGITSKHNGDNYSLNFLHSFRTKNKLESNIKLCKNKDLL